MTKSRPDASEQSADTDGPLPAPFLAADAFPVDSGLLRREKDQARELRSSAWWRKKIAAGECYYCGRHFAPSELTMDHIVPLSRGGRSVKANLAACCKDCNNRKKNLLPVEWADYLQRLRRELL
ncbi:MAG: HNH endonuclease [Leptospirales bacterium]|nr:HNH endonuclease [Leptospirales bacterium]